MKCGRAAKVNRVPRRVERQGVVVVGGGPVGLTTALLLAERGVPVTVFERNREVPEDDRASTFHAPTLDLLEECGITAFLRSSGLECPLFQYRGWKEGKIAEFDHALLAADTRHTYRLQCEQYKLTRHLHERLSDLPGVNLRFGWEVTGIGQDEDGVDVSVRRDGEASAFRARYLVGADGGQSPTRKAIGVAFPGFTYPENHAHILRIPDLRRMSLHRSRCVAGPSLTAGQPHLQRYIIRLPGWKQIGTRDDRANEASPQTDEA